MILAQGKLELRDHHLCSIAAGEAEKDWVHPEGTHYLLAKAPDLELEGGCRIKSPSFCALSLLRPYKVHSAEIFLRISVTSYLGLNQWTEFSGDQPGRLSYIDGCSNSNLIAPLKNGDPCVNYLFIPPGTDQSAHVHPTARIGFITGGRGTARIWENGQSRSIELNEGTMFLLPRLTKHCFQSQESFLSVLVFHPDSEGGPLDQLNPMYSRTFISPMVTA